MKRSLVTMLALAVMLIGPVMASAEEEVIGLTPLFGGETLGCTDTCVDVWELKCPTGAITMDVALFDTFDDGERFLALLTGLAPLALYGKTDSDWAQGATGAFVVLSRAAAGNIKALMNVVLTALPSGFNDYDFEFHCHGVGGVFKNGSLVKKQDQ